MAASKNMIGKLSHSVSAKQIAVLRDAARSPHAADELYDDHGRNSVNSLVKRDLMHVDTHGFLRLSGIAYALLARLTPRCQVRMSIRQPPSDAPH